MPTVPGISLTFKLRGRSFKAVSLRGKDGKLPETGEDILRLIEEKGAIGEKGVEFLEKHSAELPLWLRLFRLLSGWLDLDSPDDPRTVACFEFPVPNKDMHARKWHLEWQGVDDNVWGGQDLLIIAV